MEPDTRFRFSRPIRAVLFDMDGVLLDTERFYTEVTQEYVSRYGKTFDWSVKSLMVGRPAIEAARTLVEALDLPVEPEDYLRERAAGLEARMPDADPMPGAVELTRALAGAGVPIAVATSSPTHLFDLKTRRHGEWFEIFDAFVRGDDPRVARGKPAPDIFLVAAAQIGADPIGCLVVEDAPAGVEAAHAAGMQALAVPYPGMDPDKLAAAEMMVTSLADVGLSDLGLEG
jgi:pseudouridine-5'-monophosphatase